MKEEYLSYNNVALNEKFPPIDFTVTGELVEKYITALNLDGDFYRELGEVPSSLIDRCARLPQLLRKLLPAGTIHARQYNEFIGNVKVGDTIRSIARISDKYIKKERVYIVIEVVSVGGDGKIINIAQSTIILPDEIGDGGKDCV